MLLCCMEERKLIQHGPSSLTIALPKKWLDARGLKKGDGIYVSEEGNKLILNTKKALKIDKITITVAGLDATSVYHYIQSLYRYGYNEIEVCFETQTTKKHRDGQTYAVSSLVHEKIRRYIGMQIIEQSANRILLKSIIKETDEDFTMILRRIFLLLKDASESLYFGAKDNNYATIKAIKEKHDTIITFVNYTLRLLNKYGYPDVKKTCCYYHIIASLDQITDILREISDRIIIYNKALHKESIIFLEKIHWSLVTYYKLFYKFSILDIEALSKHRFMFRQLLKQKLKKLPVEEIRFITTLEQIHEILADLVEQRMALEY